LDAIIMPYRHGVSITLQAVSSEVSGMVSEDTAQKRIRSIDMLRGLANVLMALDHTRDFFGASGPNPRDIADPAVFLTRWITHFCAPTFIFLAGASAYLYGRRKRSAGQLSWFLLTRGLWLIFIELTLVRFGWNLTFDSKLFFAGVIWVIGASMIVLAALVYLPQRAIAAIALIRIAGHNLLDGIPAGSFGSVGSGIFCTNRAAFTSGGTARSLSLIPSSPGRVLWPWVRLWTDVQARSERSAPSPS
jgi:uncharacterized membrane protein